MTIFWGMLIFIAGAACGVAGHYAVVSLGVARSFSGEDDGVVLTLPEHEKLRPSECIAIPDDFWAPSRIELAARNFCEKKTTAAYRSLAKALDMKP